MNRNDIVFLIREYVEDSVEFLEEYDRMLLQLEAEASSPPPQLLAELQSGLHTFKGNSGLVGFSPLQTYIHKLETLFKGIQSGAIRVTTEVIDFLMSSSGIMRRVIEGIDPDQGTCADLAAEQAALEAFITAAGNCGDGPACAAPAQALSGAAVFSRMSSFLRVDLERLDHLLNLMGELIIYRTRLGKIEAQLKDEFGEKGIIADLADTSEQIGKTSSELHEAIMKVRMLPIKQVFMRFPRLVRELGREKGKEVELLFEGEETELDKTVIDEIGEPLVHLIRNAVDHGIESPSERLARGKERVGRILLKAFQESSHIIILAEDDGRGIDVDRLREKASQSGFQSRQENDAYALQELVFLPGLSTAETVTETSGRGIGMDVVRKSLAKINGSVEVWSERGIGTRFTIKLPLTLAIVSALMVEASRELFAIPLAAVVESIKIDAADIHLVEHREVVTVRGRILPLVRLSSFFNLPAQGSGGHVYVVVTQSTTGQVGVIVDALVGRQEIVIKPLDDYLGRARGVAGATILGDGKVVLIVDVPSLMNSGAKGTDERGDSEAARG
jgi:two-component system chemotaxis sensor kinase CheA